MQLKPCRFCAPLCGAQQTSTGRGHAATMREETGWCDSSNAQAPASPLASLFWCPSQVYTSGIILFEGKVGAQRRGNRRDALVLGEAGVKVVTLAGGGQNLSFRSARAACAPAYCVGLCSRGVSQMLYEQCKICQLVSANSGSANSTQRLEDGVRTHSL